MTTIAEKLLLLSDTKTQIKNAIAAKGVSVGAEPFSDYPGKIAAIPGPEPPPSSAEYRRPADWLELPAIGAAEQKIVALHAVYPSDANFVAFQISGAYTVDWGDGGAPQNFAAGATAEKKYNYESIGSATWCARGYRQAIITITPQAGENLTSVDFNKNHSAVGTFYTGGFLDIRMRGSQIGSLAVSNLNAAQRNLEIFEFYGTNQLVSAVTLFRYCWALQKVLIDFANVTDASFAFNFCYSLRRIDLNSGAVTTANTMFGTCALLETVNINFASVTNANSAFNGCSSLRELSLDFGSVTSATGTFTSCNALRSLLLPNAGLVTIDLSQNVKMLSAAALDALYTSVGIATGGVRQLRVTGCHGYPQSNPSIATGKGWTIA
ncbi:MAG: leucine-rich repeat protein [Pyrinomonadaceae bacterium]|nr:leucine-rich repeat protein [Pyrinomonadaceae bacterium]